MPVMTKSKMATISREINSRFDVLMDYISPRGLKSAKEGAGRGSWVRPDEMVATKKMLWK